jgi:hypothetical protein
MNQFHLQHRIKRTQILVIGAWAIYYASHGCLAPETEDHAFRTAVAHGLWIECNSMLDYPILTEEMVRNLEFDVAILRYALRPRLIN